MDVSGPAEIASSERAERARREDKNSSKGRNLMKGIRQVAQGKGGESGSVGGDIAALHSGGKVRKTGSYRLRKGETVMTKGQVKRMKRGRGKKRG
jgi:hypothetical protein